MTEKMWFVFDATNKLVLSGYGLKSEALQEAEKVRKELIGPDYGRIEVIVLPRNDARVQRYAQTHPCWAERNN
ncbi:unnamed protein product, partial [marine sediment metagenome]